MSCPDLRLALGAVLACLMLNGCAVMRIDVDVYKGPLANSDAVQVQQFAAMAIGVKPLLIQLRDNLILESATQEQLEDDAQDDAKQINRPKDLRGWRWYDDSGYITTLLETERAAYTTFDRDEVLPVWVNDRARRVNDLLRFYDDRPLLDLDVTVDSETGSALFALMPINKAREARMGIVNLVKAYGDAVDPRLPPSQEATELRQLLINVLVRVAEQILLIANNEKIIARSTETSAQPLHPFRETQRDQYIEVLQAVGNSILVQADELTHRAKHTEKLRRNAASERFALAASLERSARETVDEIIADLEATAKARGPELAAARKVHETAVEKVNALSRQAQTSAGAQRAFDQASQRHKDALKSAQWAIQAHQTISKQQFADLVLKPEAGATAIESDGKAIESSIKKTGDADGATVMTEIAKWVKTQIATPVTFDCKAAGAPVEPDDPRQIRLKCARQYFETPPGELSSAIGAVALRKRGDAFDAVAKVVDGHFRAEQTRIAVARTAADTAKGKIDKTLDDATNAATRAVTDAKGVADRIEKDKKGLESAASMLRLLRPGIIEEADSGGVGGDPPQVFARITAAVAEALAEARSKKAELEGASGKEGEKMALETRQTSRAPCVCTGPAERIRIEGSSLQRRSGGEFNLERAARGIEHTQAEMIEPRLKLALARADVPIVSSCFCRLENVAIPL